jgi:hypothetical protein
MAPDTSLLSSSICPFGRFKYLAMVFGLKSAPGIIQKMTDPAIIPLAYKTCMHIWMILWWAQKRRKNMQKNIEKVAETISQNEIAQFKRKESILPN